MPIRTINGAAGTGKTTRLMTLSAGAEIHNGASMSASAVLNWLEQSGERYMFIDDADQQLVDELSPLLPSNVMVIIVVETQENQ